MKRMYFGLLLAVAMAAAGFAQDQKITEPPNASDQKAAAQAPVATLTAEAQVCTSISDRMPAGTASNFGADVGTLYCWSKVTGAKGDAAVKHIWSREGKEMLSVELPVRSVSWRTFSQKKILPQWTGNWEVTVVDAGGAALATVAFTIGQ